MACAEQWRVFFLAAVGTLRRMIDARTIRNLLFLFLQNKKHLKTTKDTDMNRVQSLF